LNPGYPKNRFFSEPADLKSLIDPMKYSILIICLLSFLHFSCQKSNLTNQAENLPAVKKQRPVSVELGKIFEKDGTKYLYGGEDENQHFNITNCSLRDQQYHYGIGRERFSALLQPEFISLNEADSIFTDEDRFLLLKIANTSRAYSIKDLTHHEVINDEVEGQKVMAAYCILADLGAVYDRNYYDRDFTFALSGYTYFDPSVWDGMDGFVMWDRETESLWWPLIGKAVSGPMKGTKMKVLDEKYWAQTTWSEIKRSHPNVDVLKPGQDFERPSSWKKYTDIEQHVKSDPESQKSISPRWGENKKIEKNK
jgi:hypothetical protein